MSLITLPFEILLQILGHLHILDIFPFKLAGNRRITDAIHEHFPLCASRTEYVRAIAVESCSRDGTFKTDPNSNLEWTALRITLSRGQLNLVLHRSKNLHQLTPLRFWTGRVIKRLFRIKPHRERISTFYAREDSMPALHIAAQYGAELAVKPLVRAGETWIDCRDLRGMTPLHYAIESGWIGMVSLLLDMGASVWTQDDCKCTALSLAAQSNQKEVLRMLLNHPQSKTGWAFWHRGDLKYAKNLAAKRGFTDTVELLSEKALY